MHSVPHSATLDSPRPVLATRADLLAALLARSADPAAPIAVRVADWAELTRRLDAAYSTDDDLAPAAPGDAAASLAARRVHRVAAERDAVLHDSLRPALLAAGARFVDWRALGRTDADRLRQAFQQRVHPLLTPMAVDGAHPFPFVPALATCLAVTVADPAGARPRFGCVPLPPWVPRVLSLGAGRFVTLETLTGALLPSLFAGARIVECAAFRVTRDRVGAVTRVELEQAAGEPVRSALARHLGTAADRLHPVRSALTLGDPLSPVLDDLPAGAGGRRPSGAPS